MSKSYKIRAGYIDKVTPWIDKAIIKVLIGQRRVGKTELLKQIQREIQKKRTITKERIIFIDKEDFGFDHIKDAKQLLDYVKEKTISSDKHYIFIDEIQEIEEFEKALIHLNKDGHYDIYCTGSNAHLLSSELATRLTGRYIEIEVFPLTWDEYLQFYQINDTTLEKGALDFFQFGTLPFLIHLDNTPKIKFEYLDNIRNTIVFKDVVKRFNIRNTALLDRLILYLAQHMGSLITAKKISDFLKSQRLNISPKVILEYLNYLEQSFLIQKIPRIDVQGKKIFQISEKYFFTDHGIRNGVVGYKQADIGKILENIVCIHLRAWGYKVYVGKFPTGEEIDFVAEKQGEKIYVQVTHRIINQTTRDREFGNLLKIKDNYPKYVVSTDIKEKETYKGIILMNVKEFLLGLE